MEQFHYLLNAFERAAQADKPADAGYAEKRTALIEHLSALNRDAKRYRWLRDHWHNLCTSTGIDTHGNYCVTEIFVGPGEHAPFADGTLEAAIDAAMRK